MKFFHELLNQPNWINVNYNFTWNRNIQNFARYDVEIADNTIRDYNMSFDIDVDFESYQISDQ